jgi:hypothetical protein
MDQNKNIYLLGLEGWSSKTTRVQPVIAKSFRIFGPIGRGPRALRGRVFEWHSRGRRFDSAWLHQLGRIAIGSHSRDPGSSDGRRSGVGCDRKQLALQVGNGSIFRTEGVRLTRWSPTSGPRAWSRSLSSISNSTGCFPTTSTPRCWRFQLSVLVCKQKVIKSYKDNRGVALPDSHPSSQCKGRLRWNTYRISIRDF